MGRSTAEETLQQIKSDINKSLECYGASTYKFANGATPVYYWSKAATEMLAGEVYLWSGKVSTGDHNANGADVAVAKTYFNNVVNNYGYALNDNYFANWTGAATSNPEAIYAMCYSSTADQIYWTSVQTQIMWSKTAGSTNGWSTNASNGITHVTDGSASKFGYTWNTTTGELEQYTTWETFSMSPNRYMYKNALYYQFDAKDARRLAWFPIWEYNEAETKAAETDPSALEYCPNFVEKDHVMRGSFTLKSTPRIPDGSQNYAFNDDQPIYRLALAYMYLAEIANYEGTTADVEKYINMIRKRAFGTNWDEATQGYKAGDFAANEVAILHEKDREFYMEGQRWWDLRRLTLVKDGQQTDHLVFQPEGNVGYGLDVTANPWMTDESNGQPVVTNTPLLQKSQEHLLLWPLNKDLLDADKAIKQNPGYVDPNDVQE